MVIVTWDSNRFFYWTNKQIYYMKIPCQNGRKSFKSVWGLKTRKQIDWHHSNQRLGIHCFESFVSRYYYTRYIRPCIHMVQKSEHMDHHDPTSQESHKSKKIRPFLEHSFYPSPTWQTRVIKHQWPHYPRKHKTSSL